MAEYVDKFSDLEELGIEDDQLTVDFNKAAKHLQTLIPNVDNKILLRLYGYYKQATEGPCKTPKPSWFDMKAKSKWDAWKSMESMPQIEAKTLYIKLVQEIDPEFGNNPKTTTKTGWVTFSILQPTPEQPLDNSLRTSFDRLFDYVKESDVNKLSTALASCSTNELKQVINKIDHDGDGDGMGLIHWAADRGSVEVLKILLDHGADVNLIDVENQTPLHYAIPCGHIECVKLLLSKGADLTIKDDDGLDAVALAEGDDTMKNLIVNYK